MAPKPSDPLGILSKKCQVWWKTVTAAAPAPALGRPPRGPPGVSRCKCRGERVPRRPDCAGPQDQQWKLGRVNGYERSRNCYTIEYNGGFKEIDLVVVKHKEEDGECSPQSLCPPKHGLFVSVGRPQTFSSSVSFRRHGADYEVVPAALRSQGPHGEGDERTAGHAKGTPCVLAGMHASPWAGLS